VTYITTLWNTKAHGPSYREPPRRSTAREIPMSMRAITFVGFALGALTTSALADSRIIGHIPHNPLPHGDSGVSGLPPRLNNPLMSSAALKVPCPVCTFKAPMLTIRK
jgi:hypothetical protein